MRPYLKSVYIEKYRFLTTNYENVYNSAFIHRNFDKRYYWKYVTYNLGGTCPTRVYIVQMYRLLTLEDIRTYYSSVYIFKFVHNLINFSTFTTPCITFQAEVIWDVPKLQEMCCFNIRAQEHCNVYQLEELCYSIYKVSQVPLVHCVDFFFILTRCWKKIFARYCRNIKVWVFFQLAEILSICEFSI